MITMYAVIWMMLDLLWMMAGAWFAYVCASGPSAPWQEWETMLVGAGSPLLLAAFAMTGVYARKRRKKSDGVTHRIVPLSILAWVIASRATVSMKMHHPHVFAWLDLWLVATTILTVVSRLILGKWMDRIGHDRSRPQRVVIAGDAAYLSTWLQTGRVKPDEYAVVAALAADATSPLNANIPVLGDFENLVAKAKNHDFDELWLALPMSRQTEISRYVMALQHHFINIRLFADAQNIPLFNPAATTFAGTAFIDLVTSSSDQKDAWSKSLFDRLFALMVLLALLPMLALIAILIKGSSRGPVFFRQRRKGVDGREFTILKFRSMYVHREKPGQLTQASKNDHRVTSIGRLLRKTSLDELPQFINVLFGQMSVVGPRPHAVEHDDLYMRLIDGYMYRYRIKPGITGWAQINGARGETAKVELMARRVALDLFYIQHWSFWLDVKIVVMTIFKGFVAKNAH
ncbi:undecaprenyl-phosphate glucose phosphotransferase [Dyella monticola]|uniref:Undecaprenyl-phosphate glucose phosphotransferase n=1 Tax=Dyella monticola TaxID=1927958 RepID=A0A370X048_9GAMM|nr:undecaprenyl-phosphate glucose phosphotransferase [Dyella monticola]RDS81660.1 undecaprenyl-phosphate glucose phosphotransferase [Dyella monticola]